MKDSKSHNNSTLLGVKVFVQNRFVSLLIIMVTICLATTGMSMWILYKTALSVARERLVETAQSQARLMEAISRFDKVYSNEFPEGPIEATLSQIKDAHDNYKGFGETGEFTLARREKDEIIFLLSHRHDDLSNPKPVNFYSKLAEPMRLALSGKSGTIIGFDYRGEQVLASYEPIKELNFGIVAKIDMVEIRAPFIRAGKLIIGFMLISVLLGAFLFLKLTHPVTIRITEQNKKLKKVNSILNKEIDSRKQMEKALKESEQKYRSMMESMTDSIYICSADRIVEYMNPAMIQQTGKDASGEKCYRALFDMKEQCTWCSFDKVLAGEVIEHNIVSPRDQRQYRVNNMPVKRAGGMVSKMAIMRDITNYLKVVEEKERVKSQLQQAQRIESIGKLAGGIAHDFNNILHPILGFTQLSMEELPENHPVQENLQDILDGAKRARDLVKRILLFSRQKEQVVEPTILQPIIQETLKLLRSSIPSNIEIQSDLYDGEDYVLCDATEIHEILMNLCTNAYHAMENNGGIIRISLNRQKPDSHLNLLPEEYLCLGVSDNGMGIPAEIKEKIFNPYFTTKEVGKGSGLGLSVVHGIVKNYKGEICVESCPGSGTIFKVFLPLTTKTADPGTDPANQKLLGGSEKILFVDDEKQILKFAVRSLERFGYDVTGVEDSSKAFEIFTSDPERFDLVITDMAMPGMDGSQLAKKILEMRPDMPILICSGYSEKLDTERVKELNIKDFIDKPILIGEMTGKIREILS